MTGEDFFTNWASSQTSWIIDNSTITVSNASSSSCWNPDSNTVTPAIEPCEFFIAGYQTVEGLEGGMRSQYGTITDDYWSPPANPIADRKAELLLLEALGWARFKRARRLGYIEVTSQLRPNRLYRVPLKGGRVDVLDDGAIIEQLCAQPTIRLPRGDAALAKVLMLESAEAEFLDVANHFPAYEARD